MAPDPKGTFDAARNQAHRARKSVSRLAVSGLGFSVAYFFDPAHGSARRKHAVEVANQVRRTAGEVRSRRRQKATPSAATPAPPATAPIPRIPTPSSSGGGPAVAPAPHGVTNGSRSNSGS
jgi:hypothetical protein